MFRLVTVIAGITLFTIGCGKNTPPKEAKSTAATTAAQTAKLGSEKTAPKEPAIIETVGGNAAVIFRSRCATCHGLSGKGDGAAAVSLNPKPRDFGDAAWQKSVTDEYILKIIVGGGQAVGKSPTMTANPDLKGKTEILNGLVKIIRGLK